MKILLCGVFTYGSTDVWKKLALERLGHRVVCCPYREAPVEEHFPIGEPFDVVFVSKGVPLTAAQLAHLATLGRHRLLWWPDPFENWNEHLTAALRTGAWYVSATSEAVLRKIRGAVFTDDAPLPPGFTLHNGRILEGCDCEGPRPSWAPERVEPALLHFGSMTPRRAEIIDALRAQGVPVTVLERPAFGPSLQTAVLSHAAVLGINTSPDLYSNRVQTVLAMGGTILQEDAPDLALDLEGVLCPAGPLVSWRLASEIRPAFDRLLAACRDPAIDDSVARCVLDDFGWVRAMERALDFATGGDL